MKNIIITGSEGLIGKQIVKELAKNKHQLILIDKKRKKNSKYQYYQCNISSFKERELILKKIKKKIKRIDCIINNAAITGSSYCEGWNTSFEKQKLKYWKEVFEVNVTAIFHFCQKLFPLIKKSKNGSVINISSIYGVYAPDFSIYKNTKINNPAAYSVSKAAVVYLTKWLAKAMAPEIRVNCISPGGVFKKQSDFFKKKYLKKTALKKDILPNDIVNLINFLISEKSSKISGQNFLVDSYWNG